MGTGRADQRLVRGVSRPHLSRRHLESCDGPSLWRKPGEEALYRGKDMILGPGVNIYRTPLNGRNFEYMGEDPFLSSTMVVPYISGLVIQRCIGMCEALCAE